MRAMSAEDNKRVVRRFGTEVLGGGDLDVLPELLAPNYVNPSTGARDREAFKAVPTGPKQAFPTREFVVDGMPAEGDTVVLWGGTTLTSTNGTRIPTRLLVRSRVVNGQIVEDEPFSTPPLMEVLGGVAQPGSGA